MGIVFVWRKKPERRALVSGLRAWLTVPDSLTRQLVAVSQEFRVRVICQGQEASLCRAYSAGHRVWVRDVLLELDGQPVIFAHTELSTAQRGPLTRWLARLGTRSLGSLLFTHPGFRRSAIHYCRLDRRHPLYRRAAAVAELPSTVWARRSCHVLAGQSVLVTEIYLPGIRGFAVRTG